MQNPILVDVNIATYNHVKFISRTLTSVLTQKTNFEFQILIGDDCSNDGTRKILQKYKKKYPDKIQLHLRPKNIGMERGVIRNGVLLLEASTAKYVALLDGDDHWSDTYKLQKQVDFLERNRDFSLIGHNAKTIDHITGTEKLFFNEVRGEISIEDLILKAVKIPTLSMVYRNDLLMLPDIFHKVKAGDRFLVLLLATKGKVGLINNVMGIQNKQLTSVTKTTNSIKFKLAQYNDNLLINKFFNYKYHHEFSQILALNSKRIFKKSRNITTKLIYLIRWFYHSIQSKG